MLHENKKHLIFLEDRKKKLHCLFTVQLSGCSKRKIYKFQKNLKGRIFLCASIFYIMGKISISFFSINKIIQITLLISCQGNIDRYVELMIFYSFLSSISQTYKPTICQTEVDCFSYVSDVTWWYIIIISR